MGQRMADLLLGQVLSFTADPFAEGPIDLKARLVTMERTLIEAALGRAGGVVAEAARLLSLQRTTLIEKMNKYGISREVGVDAL